MEDTFLPLLSLLLGCKASQNTPAKSHGIGSFSQKNRGLWGFFFQTQPYELLKNLLGWRHLWLHYTFGWIPSKAGRDEQFLSKTKTKAARVSIIVTVTVETSEIVLTAIVILLLELEIETATVRVITVLAVAVVVETVRILRLWLWLEQNKHHQHQQPPPPPTTTPPTTTTTKKHQQTKLLDQQYPTTSMSWRIGACMAGAPVINGADSGCTLEDATKMPLKVWWKILIWWDKDSDSHRVGFLNAKKHEICRGVMIYFCLGVVCITHWGNIWASPNLDPHPQWRVEHYKPWNSWIPLEMLTAGPKWIHTWKRIDRFLHRIFWYLFA